MHPGPPGPYPFPIIGNIFQLGHKPHLSLATLSKTYGPLMSLQLGTITTMVVSSPKIAKEVLQKHDQVFSGRPVPHAITALDHNTVSMAWLPAEKQWRNLRKICKEHLFSSQRLNASQVLRREKVQELLDYIHECCIRSQAVDIGRVAFTTTLNLISNTIFSIDLAHLHDSNGSQVPKDIVWGLMEYVGKPNLADYFPVLRLIDPQGILKQGQIYFEKLSVIFDGIINRRIESRSSSSSRSNDLLETLLDLSQKNDSELSYKDMKHMFVVSTIFQI
ncbi:unnamed protein product [Ilex paraguariensis]|uniref:Cytochrome P450 76AD1-like protein n=1 Tax=Ilex paraguariensis TaxID=185542 RepID=A0ABC8UZJ6_9AQUA